MVNNEIFLNKGNKFSTRYGSTLEEKYPTVIYLRTKSKITPIVKQKEYNLNVNKVKKSFTIFVDSFIKECDEVNKDYLFNIDISSKGVRYGKTSFLRYDLYLKPTIKTSLTESINKFQTISLKLDNKLESLLNANGINCK